jgi:hypothetical protein
MNPNINSFSLRRPNVCSGREPNSLTRGDNVWGIMLPIHENQENTVYFLIADSVYLNFCFTLVPVLFVCLCSKDLSADGRTILEWIVKK